MIRRARPGDETGLALVHVASWQVAYRGLLHPDFLAGLDVEERTERWALILGRGRSDVFVAEVGGEVVGFSSSGDATAPGWGELYSIYVLPEHWGAGAGSSLLAAAEEAMVARGHRRALLWVLEGNARARRFYQSRGWTRGRPIRIEEIGPTQVTEVRYQRRLEARSPSGSPPR